MFVDRASDHRNADLFGDVIAHLRQAGTGHQKRNAHLRGFDHHFAGKPSGGVENFVATINTFKPHPAGDGIHRIVAAHVFDKRQNFAARIPQRATMHRAGLLVNRFMRSYIIEQRVERGLCNANVAWQLNVFQVRHQIAEHGAFTAASGLGTLGHFFIQILETVAGCHRAGIDFPVDLHRDNFINRFEQTLVAQIANHQRFRRRTQRHDGQNFALVHVDGERMFAGDGGGLRGAGFINSINRKGSGARCIG